MAVADEPHSDDQPAGRAVQRCRTKIPPSFWKPGRICDNALAGDGPRRCRVDERAGATRSGRETEGPRLHLHGSLNPCSTETQPSTHCCKREDSVCTLASPTHTGWCCAGG